MMKHIVKRPTQSGDTIMVHCGLELTIHQPSRATRKPGDAFYSATGGDGNCLVCLDNAHAADLNAAHRALTRAGVPPAPRLLQRVQWLIATKGA